MEKKKSKPKYNMWQNAAWMIAVAWREKEKKVLVLSALIALLAVATNLVNLTVVPAILSAVEQRAPIPVLTGTILGFLAVMMLCSAATAYGKENVVFGRISVRTAIIGQITQKMMRTSYPNVLDEKFLGLWAKSDGAVNNNEGSSEAVWNTLTKLIQNVMGFAVYLFLLTAVHPLLFGVILVTAAVSYAVTKYANSYSYTHREEVAKYSKQMWYLQDRAVDVTAAKDIRIFGLRPWLEELHQKALEAYQAFYGRVFSRLFWAKAVDLVLVFLRNGIAYAYLIYLVLSGSLTAAEFLLYFSAVSGFADWVTGILNSLSTLHRQSIELSVIREFLEFPEPFRFEEGEPLAPEPGRQYELRLEKVSYRYPGAEDDTLKSIDLVLHPGEKIAVVGLNGAGKTTLVKLLCGFLEPTQGRVLLDGRDIREFNRRDYYAMFSAVFQDFILLPASVAANVAQTEEDIDLDRVQDCIEKAGLRQKVESEPKGYDTLLNREVFEDAVTLSGGETQRLMLARALYKEAPFIVLDEPTAALDPIAEADMYNRYHEMTGGKSSVYISHRLASTRFCDRILLIDGNVIAEEGTHEELLSQGGRYAELFEVQSRYYKEGGREDEG